MRLDRAGRKYLPSGFCSFAGAGNSGGAFAQTFLMKKAVTILMAALACLTAACTYKDDAQEKEYAQYVRLSESVKFMVAGEEADLHAVFTPRGTAYEVEWESDAPAVAQVEEGRVRALSGGRAQIAVKIVNTTHKAVCEVIVSEKQVSEKFAGREDAP